jgi:hypothetical protein
MAPTDIVPNQFSKVLPFSLLTLVAQLASSLETRLLELKNQQWNKKY